MKKLLLLLSITLFTISSLHAQRVEKLDEYTASNGVTYKVGDEIKLGRGSDTNGRFVYVNMSGWGAVMTATNDQVHNANQNRMEASNAGMLVTIKKIKSYDKKRFKGVIFTIGAGNITNYTMDIENAIATCEVENCKTESDQVAVATSDKYDKLKKLKELFDDGVLTEEEYNAEKDKILKIKVSN